MDELRPRNRREKIDPGSILQRAYQAAVASSRTSLIADRTTQERIELVSQGKGNKSCVRALLACALAKAHNPQVDIRKPYTKIAAPDVYSGRDYDERYVGPFVAKHGLPCNETTAFLTPAFRNRNIVLTAKVDLVGRPPQIYAALLLLRTAAEKANIAE